MSVVNISVPLLITLIFSSFCFIPNFLDHSFADSSSGNESRKAFSSEIHKYSLVACFAASLPIFLDYAADSIFMLSKFWDFPNVSISKGTSVLSVLIPNAVTFFICDSRKGYEYAPAVVLIRMNIILVAFCFSIVHYGAPVWTWRNTIPMIILHGIGMVACAFKTFYYISSLYYVMMAAYALASIFGIWLTIMWVRRLLRHKSFSSITFEEYCCNIHLLGGYICLLCFWLILIIYPESWPATSTLNLCVLNYVMTAATILSIMAHARATRREADVEQVNRELIMKSSFVRYVSHEIRTPLNTLSMGLTVLKDELSQNYQHKEWVIMVEDLERSCNTSVEILNSLLTYEKLTTNILELNTGKLLVRPLASETLHPFLLQARAKQINLQLKFEGALHDEACPITVNADKSKVSQVVRNLLSNALKFTKEGGDVQVCVSVVSSADVTSEPSQASQMRSGLHLSTFSLVSLANWLRRNRRSEEYSTEEQPAHTHVLRVEVKDSGPGISVENQERLFKEIVQFNPGELQDGKGSGLGLWISHQIVSLHNGKLSVYSAGIGHGSTFTLELPLQQDSLADVNLYNPDEAVSVVSLADHSSVVFFPRDTPQNGDEKRDEERPAGSRQQGMAENDVHDGTFETRRLANLIPAARVLVVDDVELNRKMTIRLLRHVWTDFSEAEDGEAALQVVQSASESGLPIDLVLVDYQMPKMDGPTAAKAMRNMGFVGVILGVTGNGLQQDIDHFISQGANRVLIKPLRREALRDCLESVLGDH